MPIHSHGINKILGGDPIEYALQHSHDADCIEATNLIMQALGVGKFVESDITILKQFIKDMNLVLADELRFLNHLIEGDDGLIVFRLQPRRHYFSIYFVKKFGKIYFRVLQAWGDMISLLDWTANCCKEKSTNHQHLNLHHAKQSHGGQLYLSYDELTQTFLNKINELINSRDALEYKLRYDNIFGTDIPFDNLPLYFSWGTNLSILSINLRSKRN